MTQAPHVVPLCVLDDLQACGLPASQSHLLIAFSGGADSVSLLYMMKMLSDAQKTPFAVSAFHVNHGIRGEEAKRDALFCSDFCQKHGISLTSMTVDVPSLAKESGRSLEEEARMARYRLLAEHIDTHPEITHLLTAHHADDQAETVLFRMLRGTSPKGLCGIPLMRQFAAKTREVPLIRPLLHLTKQQILSYCENNKLSFVIDSTNMTADASRNLLRNILLPAAKEINPAFSEALLRLSSSAAADEAYFRDTTASFLKENLRDGNKISLASLRELHTALLYRVLTEFYASVSTNPLDKPLTSAHLDAMVYLITTETSVGLRTHCLPGKHYFHVFPSDDLCTITTAADPISAVSFSTDPIPLKIGIPQRLPNGDICLLHDFSMESEKNLADLKNIYKLFISTHINFDKLIGSIYIRPRTGNNCDHYVCGGHTKTVKDALSEHKVPIAKRSDIPLLCDDNGIFYIPFCGIRDTVNPRYSEKTPHILDIYYFSDNERTDESHESGH